MSDLQYSIKVYKQYFNFAAAHFIIFDDGTREPLHGHNYHIKAEGSTPDLKDDMVFDFLQIKPIIRDVCNSLDHRLILPSDNPLLSIENCGNNYFIETSKKENFSFPKSDVLLLPIHNVSAERLAIYIANQVNELTKIRFNFIFETLKIEVEETLGQSAVYVLNNKELQ